MSEDQKKINNRSPGQIVADITRDLAVFNDSYREQFHVRIPKGVLRRIDDYRDEFFPYLKDSVYKSNLCYFLQLIDYQLWLYKVFRPSLSLANSLFYQLSTTMGMILELLAFALLADPVLITDSSDRSKGQIKRHYRVLDKKITEASFVDNIRLLSELGVLSEEQCAQLHSFRVEVRNLVHIQNWDGRIYESFTAEHFQENFDLFRKLLRSLKTGKNTTTDLNNLCRKLQLNFPDENQQYEGQLITYFPEKNHGFIRDDALNTSYYFSTGDVAEDKSRIEVGKRYSFRVTLSWKDKEAYALIPLAAKQIG